MTLALSAFNMDDADSIRQTIKTCTAILVFAISAAGSTIASTNEGFNQFMMFVLIALMATSLFYLLFALVLGSQVSASSSDPDGGR